MVQSARTGSPLAKPTVLVVETSEHEQAWIRDALEPTYHVDFAPSLDAALPEPWGRWPDLFLAPARTPAEGELELSLAVSEQGRRRAVPIVLRPGLDSDAEEGLAAEPPASPDALLARIRERLDAVAAPESHRPTLREWGRLRIDFETLRVWVLDGPGADEVLDLTLREFRILQFLVENEGRVVTRRELLDEVWRGVVVAPRAVDTHVCNLRKKLGPLRACVGSIRGVGYRFQIEGA